MKQGGVDAVRSVGSCRRSPAPLGSPAAVAEALPDRCRQALVQMPGEGLADCPENLRIHMLVDASAGGDYSGEFLAQGRGVRQNVLGERPTLSMVEMHRHDTCCQLSVADRRDRRPAGRRDHPPSEITSVRLSSAVPPALLPRHDEVSIRQWRTLLHRPLLQTATTGMQSSIELITRSAHQARSHNSAVCLAGGELNRSSRSIRLTPPPSLDRGQVPGPIATQKLFCVAMRVEHGAA